MIPRYQRILFWSLAAGIFLMAAFLLRGCEQAHERLAALTAREREVVALVAEGKANEQIAEQLFVSPLTARTHVHRAMAKLDARDRAQLVVIAYQAGLVRPTPLP